MKIKRFFLINLMLFTTLLLTAQPALQLIPTPKSVDFQSGSFEFDSRTTIFVENPDSETLFAAKELISEIQHELGFLPTIVNAKSGKQIIFCLLGHDNEASKLLVKQKIEIPAGLGEEGYVLCVSTENVFIVSTGKAGQFYGVQTLKQLIRANRKRNSIACVNISDTPGMHYRGWMDDISRGPIPTAEFIKKEIRTLAEFKLNFFNLYTENVFQSSLYPDLSPIDGLTANEIKELANYAAQYHIELMGNFQSFGHQEKMLSNPFYASLAENNNILSPATEGTYKFLSGIYSEMIPAYKSNFFNINCDETFGLGEGQSKSMTDSLGEAGVYAYHINRLDKLIKPYGKRIMMWGDIAINNKEIIRLLPKDLIILSWGYQAAESFDDAILPFVQSGFEFMVAPGVGCWGELWPAMSNAMVNISNYTRDGAKNGAMGVINTAWDDNGHNLFEYNWHGLAWGAECSWSPASPLKNDAANAERNSKEKKFNEAFDAIFFQNKGVTNFYMRIDSLRFQKAKGLLGESGFWEDILNIFPTNTSPEYVIANEEAISEIKHMLNDLKTLRQTTVRNTENLDYAEFALRRAQFAAQKNIVRAQLYSASQNNDAAAIKEVKNKLQTLVTELHGIKNTYIELWKRENRNFWLDKNMNDYNEMASRIMNVDKQVYIDAANDIIDGKRNVTLKTLFNDQTIVFTTDGSEPRTTSEIYSLPLQINSTTTIKASVLTQGKTYGMAQKQISLHKGIGNLLRLNSTYSTYNPAYSAGGENALLDGIKGSDDFADGRWQGFQGQNLDIEINFKKPIDVHSISIDCMQNTYSWIVLPSRIDIYSSEDGKKYTLHSTITHSIPIKEKGQFVHAFTTHFNTLHTQYLKIIAINSGNLPAWHHAAGGESFIFADEIEIE